MLESASRATSFFEAGALVEHASDTVRDAAELATCLRAPFLTLASEWGMHLRRADGLLAKRQRAEHVLGIASSLEGIEAARSALSGLLYGVGSRDSAIDYSSLLDVLDLLRAAGESPQLKHLHCLQDLECQRAEALGAVRSCLLVDTLSLSGAASVADDVVMAAVGRLLEQKPSLSFENTLLGLELPGSSEDIAAVVDKLASKPTTLQADVSKESIAALLFALSRAQQVTDGLAALEDAFKGAMHDALTDLRLQCSQMMGQQEADNSSKVDEVLCTSTALPAYLDALMLVSAAILERCRLAFEKLRDGFEYWKAGKVLLLKGDGATDADVLVTIERSLVARQRDCERRLQEPAAAAWAKALTGRAALLSSHLNLSSTTSTHDTVADGGLISQSSARAQEIGDRALSEVQTVGTLTVRFCELLALPGGPGSRLAAQLRSAVQRHCRAVLERMHASQLDLLNGIEYRFLLVGVLWDWMLLGFGLCFLALYEHPLDTDSCMHANKRPPL